MYNTIIDPVTGKFVDVESIEGTGVLNQYLHEAMYGGMPSLFRKKKKNLTEELASARSGLEIAKGDDFGAKIALKAKKKLDKVTKAVAKKTAKVSKTSHALMESTAKLADAREAFDQTTATVGEIKSYKKLQNKVKKLERKKGKQLTITGAPDAIDEGIQQAADVMASMKIKDADEEMEVQHERDHKELIEKQKKQGNRGIVSKFIGPKKCQKNVGLDGKKQLSDIHSGVKQISHLYKNIILNPYTHKMLPTLINIAYNVAGRITGNSGAKREGQQIKVNESEKHNYCKRLKKMYNNLDQRQINKLIKGLKKKAGESFDEEFDGESDEEFDGGGFIAKQNHYLDKDIDKLDKIIKNIMNIYETQTSGFTPETQNGINNFVRDTVISFGSNYIEQTGGSPSLPSFSKTSAKSSVSGMMGSATSELGKIRKSSPKVSKELRKSAKELGKTASAIGDSVGTAAKQAGEKGRAGAAIVGTHATAAAGKATQLAASAAGSASTAGKKALAKFTKWKKSKKDDDSILTSLLLPAFRYMAELPPNALNSFIKGSEQQLRVLNSCDQSIEQACTLINQIIDKYGCSYSCPIPNCGYPNIFNTWEELYEHVMVTNSYNHPETPIWGDEKAFENVVSKKHGCQMIAELFEKAKIGENYDQTDDRLGQLGSFIGDKASAMKKSAMTVASAADTAVGQITGINSKIIAEKLSAAGITNPFGFEKDEHQKLNNILKDAGAVNIFSLVLSNTDKSKNADINKYFKEFKGIIDVRLDKFSEGLAGEKSKEAVGKLKDMLKKIQLLQGLFPAEKEEQSAVVIAMDEAIQAAGPTGAATEPTGAATNGEVGAQESVSGAVPPPPPFTGGAEIPWNTPLDKIQEGTTSGALRDALDAVGETRVGVTKHPLVGGGPFGWISNMLEDITGRIMLMLMGASFGDVGIGKTPKDEEAKKLLEKDTEMLKTIFPGKRDKLIKHLLSYEPFSVWVVSLYRRLNNQNANCLECPTEEKHECSRTGDGADEHCETVTRKIYPHEDCKLSKSNATDCEPKLVALLQKAFSLNSSDDLGEIDECNTCKLMIQYFRNYYMKDDIHSNMLYIFHLSEAINLINNLNRSEFNASFLRDLKNENILPKVIKKLSTLKLEDDVNETEREQFKTHLQKGTPESIKTKIAEDAKTSVIEAAAAAEEELFEKLAVEGDESIEFNRWLSNIGLTDWSGDGHKQLRKWGTDEKFAPDIVMDMATDTKILSTQLELDDYEEYHRKQAVGAITNALKLRSVARREAVIEADAKALENGCSGDCDVVSFKKNQQNKRVDAVKAENTRLTKLLKDFEITATKVKDAKQLKANGQGAVDLKKQGFSALVLKKTGFSLSELKEADFSLSELKTGGFLPSDLKEAGFSLSGLKGADFSAGDLKKAGFSLSELKKAGFSAVDLKISGFSLSELKKAGWDSLVEAMLDQQIHQKFEKNGENIAFNKWLAEKPGAELTEWESDQHKPLRKWAADGKFSPDMVMDMATKPVILSKQLNIDGYDNDAAAAAMLAITTALKERIEARRIRAGKRLVVGRTYEKCQECPDWANVGACCETITRSDQHIRTEEKKRVDLELKAEQWEAARLKDWLATLST